MLMPGLVALHAFKLLVRSCKCDEHALTHDDISDLAMCAHGTRQKYVRLN
jgi:hypothetical protein